MGKEEYNHYVAVLHFKVVPFMQSIGVVHRLRASVLCITQMFSKFRQPNDLTYRLGKIRSQSESRHLKKKRKTTETKHLKLPTPQGWEIRTRYTLNLQLWPPLPSTSLEAKVPSHPTLESFKFGVLGGCDFRHLETESVCYNASLYHVKMFFFSIEEKNS